MRFRQIWKYCARLWHLPPSQELPSTRTSPPPPLPAGPVQDTINSEVKVFQDRGSKRSIMQTLQSMRSSSQDLESKQSPICQALRRIDTAARSAPDYEGTILPVLDYKATSQDNLSAPQPAPSHGAAASSADKRSTTTSMAPATLAPLVMPDAPRSPASPLSDFPCRSPIPMACGPSQGRVGHNTRCTHPAWAPCGIALRPSGSTVPLSVMPCWPTSSMGLPRSSSLTTPP